MSLSIRTGQRFRDVYCKNWTKFYLWGIIFIILGFLAVYAAAWSTLMTVFLLGILLATTGFVVLFDTFTFWWGIWEGFFANLIFGLIYAGAGFMLIYNPVLGSLTLTWLLAIVYMVLGVIRIAASLSMRLPHWGWAFFNGLITAGLGALILNQWPASGLYVIGLFVGIDLVFTGISYIATASAAREFCKK